MSDHVKVFRGFNQWAFGGEHCENWSVRFDPNGNGRINPEVVAAFKKEWQAEHERLRGQVATQHPDWVGKSDTPWGPHDAPSLVRQAWQAEREVRAATALQRLIEQHGTAYLAENIRQLPTLLQRTLGAIEQIDYHPVYSEEGDGTVDNIPEALARAQASLDEDVLASGYRQRELLERAGIGAAALNDAIHRAGLQEPVAEAMLKQQARGLMAHAEQLSRTRAAYPESTYDERLFYVYMWPVADGTILGRTARIEFLDKDYDGILKPQEMERTLQQISKAKKLVAGSKLEPFDIEQIQQSRGWDNARIQQAFVAAKRDKLAQLDELAQACKQLQQDAGPEGIRYMRDEFYALPERAQRALLRMIDVALDDNDKTRTIQDGVIDAKQVKFTSLYDWAVKRDFDPDNEPLPDTGFFLSNWLQKMFSNVPPSVREELAHSLKYSEELRQYLGLAERSWDEIRDSFRLPEAYPDDSDEDV